jgi:hypothetical protein
MAKIPFGILGPFIGSIGPVTGKMWKDKGTISAKRNEAKTDKNPTPAQLNQREKFGFVNRFLHGASDLVKMTFRELATSRTEFQRAVSYNVSNAVSGAYPDYTMHYDLVSVGRGTLPNAVLSEAKPGDTPGEICFVWADNTGIGTAAAADKAIAVIYLPNEKCWAYNNSLQEAQRSDCSIILNLRHHQGTVHTWLLFTDGKGKASDSVYTGALTLT